MVNVSTIISPSSSLISIISLDSPYYPIFAFSTLTLIIQANRFSLLAILFSCKAMTRDCFIRLIRLIRINALSVAVAAEYLSIVISVFTFLALSMLFI